MLFQYVLCSARLEGTELLAELLKESDSRRVRALVRERLPEGLENCDIWIAPSQTAILYVSSLEIRNALRDWNDCRKDKRLNSVFSGIHPQETNLRAHASSSLQKLLTRIANFLNFHGRTRLEEQKFHERERQHFNIVELTGPRKIVLCEYPNRSQPRTICSDEYVPEEVRFPTASKRAPSTQNVSLDNLFEFDWLLFREFYRESIDEEFACPPPFGAQDSRRSMDVLHLAWAHDTKAAMRIIEQLLLSSPSGVSRGSHRYPARTCNRPHLFSFKSCQALVGKHFRNLPSSMHEFRIHSRALALVPGIGARLARNRAERTLMLPPQVLFGNLAEFEQHFSEDKAFATILHHFLNKSVIPSAETADSLIYLDLLSHRELWFGQSSRA
ncbi:hypothetical protein CCYA_CCYA05G1572 [Cyanidiococcus yangmingshanensis]|nr:hypothetical protein CCYA_CCYA05G1572 [Cyanidiococcus yangmingshanensis]